MNRYDLPHRRAFRRANLGGIGLLLVACACTRNSSSMRSEARGPRRVAFDYVGPSWIRAPANIGGIATHVIFDTGGGLTIVSKALCRKLK